MFGYCLENPTESFNVRKFEYATQHLVYEKILLNNLKTCLPNK